MFNILIGEISSNKGVVIAKYIKKYYNDVKIFSYDNLKYTKRIHTRYSDKHIVILDSDINSYLDKICNLISEFNIDLFLPVHSDYIGEIIKRKKKYGKSLNYLGCYEDYENLHIKSKLQKIAEELCINVPKEYLNIDDAVIPFVGKPVNKSSSKGVIYCKTIKNFHKYKNRSFSNYIFQEFIEGIGCGYSVYAINGKIQAEYAHKRLIEFPYSGGSSIYRKSIEGKEMKQVAQMILSKIKWTGFVMFEFKYTKDKKFILIETNPRIWGSINQGLMNGSDFFSSLIPNDLKKITPQLEESIYTYMSPQIYYSFFQCIINLDFKKIRYFFENKYSNSPDVSLKDDFKGYLSIILRSFYRKKNG
ncbi:hypothetical protein TRIP_D260012 [uncultured Paludibacter sp.]|uniref:ATP-grasp domain-containing protein n=1 Tax=uncultured Paludibacter sp. TaxID=497635 RepID=A0A653A9I9_9BACT|nr:hypothetical protein TRIP_D260012 [uncultured Paludibacter sp.]